MSLADFLLRLPGYSEDWLPTGVILGVICLLEFLLAKRRGLQTGAAHELGKVLFALYLIIILQMTVPLSSILHTLQMGEGFVRGNVMMEPFLEIRNFWNYGSREEIAVNLVGNVGMFLPMGLFPPLLWRCFRKLPGSLLWAVAWGVIPSAVIEVLQLPTPRATSIDDIILNAAGALLGFGLFWVLRIFGLGKNTMLTRRFGNHEH